MHKKCKINMEGHIITPLDGVVLFVQQDVECREKEADEEAKQKSKTDTMHLREHQCVLTSVGEVWSGPVPGHFCRTGDWTVWSQTKILGPGPGLPGTVYIGLVPVQTRSRWSSFSFYFIFQVTMHVRGAYLQRRNLPMPSFSVCPLHHQPHEMYASHLGVLLCMSIGSS